MLVSPALAGRQLLEKIGETIPQLKSRRDGKVAKPGVPGLALPGYPETLMPIAASAVPGMAEAAPGGSSSGGGGGGGSSKKKNKGK